MSKAELSKTGEIMIKYGEGKCYIMEKAKNNIEYANQLREICNDPNGGVLVSGELWLQIADKIQNTKGAEFIRLQDEIIVATDKLEAMQQKHAELVAKVEFYKAKKEAYEYALRCLGGKYGD